jgi:RNA-binding protein
MLTEMETLKELKQKARSLVPAIRVGKLGVTESLISEIKQQLKKNKLIKVKILGAALVGKEKEEIVELLVKKTNALLVGNVGFVVTLYWNGEKKDAIG